MERGCILLADRHQNVLEGLRGLLEARFTKVVMVANQPSLLEALDRIEPELAVVDLSVLGHDKVNATHELNRRFPDVGFVILSDYDESDIADGIMSAGASAFVLKRCAGTDLYDAIKRAQKKQTYVSPAVKKMTDDE